VSSILSFEKRSGSLSETESESASRASDTKEAARHNATLIF